MSSELLEYLPQNIARVIKEERDFEFDELIEIRLRVNQPLHLITYYCDLFPFSSDQELMEITGKDMDTAFRLLTRNSVYAVERQLAEGFITIPGGHRVGF